MWYSVLWFVVCVVVWVVLCNCIMYCLVNTEVFFTAESDSSSSNNTDNFFVYIVKISLDFFSAMSAFLFIIVLLALILYELCLCLLCIKNPFCELNVNDISYVSGDVYKIDNILIDDDIISNMVSKCNLGDSIKKDIDSVYYDTIDIDTQFSNVSLFSYINNITSPMRNFDIKAKQVKDTVRLSGEYDCSLVIKDNIEYILVDNKYFKCPDKNTVFKQVILNSDKYLVDIVYKKSSEDNNIINDFKILSMQEVNNE